MSHIVIAPDSFKGTFSSPQVAAAIAAGVRRAGASADECPAADGGELVAGAPYVLDALRFDARIRGATAVITGEGQLDEQTAAGKLIGTIAERAAAATVPVHAIVGRNELDAAGARTIGLCDVTEATTLAELEAAGEALAMRLR